MKAKPVIPRALARLDVEDAISFYLEEVNSAIAMGFIESLEKAFSHIGRQPGTGSPRYGHELNIPNLRAWSLGRYPYWVFFVELADHIDVWRVLHEKRDIPAWMQSPEN